LAIPLLSLPCWSITAIKLRKNSPLLTKEGTGVVKKVNFIQPVNYHPPTPSLRKRGSILLNLMAVMLQCGSEHSQLIDLEY
jgi:hypothetical protein